MYDLYLNFFSFSLTFLVLLCTTTIVKEECIVVTEVPPCFYEELMVWFIKGQINRGKERDIKAVCDGTFGFAGGETMMGCGWGLGWSDTVLFLMRWPRLCLLAWRSGCERLLKYYRL